MRVRVESDSLLQVQNVGLRCEFFYDILSSTKFASKCAWKDNASTWAKKVETLPTQ